MIKNTHGLYVVKSIELGQVIVQSEHSRFKVFYYYDFDVDSIKQFVNFTVGVKEVHVLINEDCDIFIELSKFDKHFLKALSLVIIEHMENQ